MADDTSASVLAGSPWLDGWAPRKGRLARARLSLQAQIAEIERHAIADLLPGPTILDCIAAQAALVPSKPAMIALASADLTTAPRTLTYAELAASITRCANLFAELAGGETPSVANILPMIPEGLICSYAAAACGIATPVNPFLELHHIAGILRASRTNILVTTDDHVWAKLGPLVREVPTLRHVLLVDGKDKGIDLATQASKHSGDRRMFRACNPDKPSVHLPTGGTTAAPKLARLSQTGLLTVAWVVGTLMGPQEDGVVGHAMPNFHVGGLCSLGLRALVYGQTLLTLTKDGFRDQGVIRNFWDIARHYRMTSVLSTPTTAAALLGDREARADGHVLTDYHCGGSTVPVALMRGFHDRFGVWLRENWGMTELHGTMTGHPNDEREPVIGSVGCSLPFFRTRAVTVDDDNVFVGDCGPGERGALALGGPTVMDGYVDASLDKAFFIEGMPDGRRWANSGDVGTVDERGYVWLYGRSKDVIIRGGHNIDPKPVEEVLVQCPGVQLAAMVGKPDRFKGELPVAYVQPKAGAALDTDTILRFCADHVHERAALPTQLIVLDALPLTPVGKISKPALKLDILSRTVDEVLARHGIPTTPSRVTIDTAGRRPKVTVRLPPGHRPDGVVSDLAGFEFDSLVDAENAEPGGRSA